MHTLLTAPWRAQATLSPGIQIGLRVNRKPASEPVDWAGAVNKVGQRARGTRDTPLVVQVFAPLNACVGGQVSLSCSVISD
jgi:hypothetical protein